MIKHLFIKGILILTIIVSSSVLVTLPTQAAKDNVSPATTYLTSHCESGSERGPFLCNIQDKCIKTGDCELNDIMWVVHNTGNFVLGIIGGLVLLMYIIGGTYFIAGGGNESRITKGKQYLKLSTVGLLIVMFAWIGINTLQSVLKGTGQPTDDVTYVPCGPGDRNKGQPCGIRQVCSSFGSCVSQCDYDHPKVSTGPDDRQIHKDWNCVDKNSPTFSELYTAGTCQKAKCPDPSVDVQCCQFK
ncbi:pilin [Patescibacteria group bacterium]